MVKAFMYHDIRDLNNTKFKSRLQLKSFLNVKQFRNQIKYIKQNYTIIDPNDLLNITNFNKNYAILTFDDGLLDHYNITSILLDNKITGTFLIPSNAVQNRSVIKSHKIQFILDVVDEKKIVKRIFDELHNMNQQQLWNKYSLSKWKTNWWSKEMVFVTNILRNHKQGDMITNKLFNEFVTADEVDFCAELYLSEQHLNEMKESGMKLGGHGHVSEALPNLNQENDISQSIKYIKRFTNDELIFSYPNGLYDNKTIDILKKYNCKFGFTTKIDNITKETDLLQIPRYDAPQTLPL